MENDCYVDPIHRRVTDEEMEKASLGLFMVEGMGCLNCAARVRNALVQVNGVFEAEVNHIFGSAEVYYDPALVEPNEIIAAVALAGNDGRHAYQAYPVRLS